MQVGRSVIVLTLVLIATGSRAQTGDDSGIPAPPAREVQLLDTVPDYGMILRHQWTEGLPPDVDAAQQSVVQYGRLLPGPPRTASLPECIALAIENNTELRIQRLAPVGATANVRRATSIFDPAFFTDILRDRNQTPAVSVLSAGGSPTLFTQNFTVNAGVRKTLRTGGLMSLSWYNNKFTANPSLVNPLTPRYTSVLGLSVSQPLLRDFGWNYAMLIVEIAQNTEQQSYFTYKAAIATLIARVEQVYWRLVLALQNIRVQEEALSFAQEVLRQNEGKFNVGSLPRTAVLEAQAEVARREAILIQSRNAADVARDNLRALVNAPAADSANLLMLDPGDRPTAEPHDIDLERSLQTALVQRPELEAARLDIRGRGLARKVAENQLLPKLNFLGGIGVNGLAGRNSYNVGSSPITIPPPDPSVIGSYDRALSFLPDGRFYNYSAGATIEIPIDNAKAKADYARSNVDFEQSRLGLQKVEETVTLEIKNAVTNLRTDLKSIEARRIARELAEENVRNQQARFDVGLATTKDLLDYQDKLNQARFAEVEALTSYNIGLAELRRAEGSLLAARNVLIERVTPEATPWWASF